MSWSPPKNVKPFLREKKLYFLCFVGIKIKEKDNDFWGKYEKLKNVILKKMIINCMDDIKRVFRCMIEINRR